MPSASSDIIGEAPPEALNDIDHLRWRFTEYELLTPRFLRQLASQDSLLSHENCSFLLPESSEPYMDEMLQGRARELETYFNQILDSQKILANKLSSQQEHIIRFLDDLVGSQAGARLASSDAMSAEQPGILSESLKAEAATLSEYQVALPIESKIPAESHDVRASHQVPDPAVEEQYDISAGDSYVVRQRTSEDGRQIEAHPSEAERKHFAQCYSKSDRTSEVTPNVFPASYVQQLGNAKPDSRRSMGSATPSTWTNVVKHPSFEALSMLVIFLNAIAMLVGAQYEGHGVAYSLGVAGYNDRKEEAWPKLGMVLEVCERFFIIFFTLELAVCLAAYRLRFFKRATRWLDFIVVVAGLADWIAGNLFDPTMIRLLRFIRLGRIMRTFNNPRMVDALYFLTASIKASLSVLLWSLAVLTIIQCIAALTISQSLSRWFDDAPKTPETRQVFMYYGTFSRSMLTMFEVLLANWIVPCRVLSDHVGEFAGLLMLVYRCVCGFAVLNVISAVFINQTMKIMSQDTDIMLMERGRAEEKYRVNLERLFTLLDMSQDGRITEDEMIVRLEAPEVHLACFKMGIGIHDLEDILRLCNMDKDGMPIHQFIQVAHDIRKQANTLDVARVLVHAKNTAEQISRVQNRLDRMEIKLDVAYSESGVLIPSIAKASSA